MSNALIGLWSLTTFYIQSSDKRPVRYPFGVNPFGLLSYHQNGYMQAILAHQERTAFPNDLEHAHRASVTDKATAFDESISYAARWHFDGTHVHHAVLNATNPQIIGETLTRRLVTTSADAITLSYAIESKNGQVDYILNWHRVLDSE